MIPREQYFDKVIEIVNQAYQSFGQLSITIPSPIRDHIFLTTVVNIISNELPSEHQAKHCNTCVGTALALSLNALGWEDRNLPRPRSTKERMDALLEQFEIALKFLDSVHLKIERS